MNNEPLFETRQDGFRFRWNSLFFTALSILVLMACQKVQSVSAPSGSPLPKIAGNYLVAGGQAWVRLNDNPADRTTGNPNYYIVSRIGTLRIARLVYVDPELLVDRVFDLVPSKIVPGDWDMIALLGVPKGPTTKTMIAPGVIVRATNESPVRLLQPIPSYLHRIDAPNIETYFKEMPKLFPTQKESSHFLPLINVAKQLIATHRDDLFVEDLYLQALAIGHRGDELHQEIDHWRAAYRQTSNPYLKQFFACAEHNLKTIELSAQGRNSFDFFTDLHPTELNLNQTFQTWRKLANFERYSPGICYTADYPNFLYAQEYSKIASVLSEFMMIQGRRPEALDLVASTYYFGQCMNQSSGTLLHDLIGISFKAIGERGLEIYMLNGCETAEEISIYWKQLEWFESRHRSPTVEQLLWLEDPAFAYLPSDARPNYKEVTVRQATADARFEILRLATAARGTLIQTGQMPANTALMGNWLSAGIPLDPFTSAPLHYVASPSESLCYSLGPDKADDGGQIAYDPTNGTISRGDVFLKVPRERQYPFPAEGLHAATAADVARQFPHGLPPDLFAYSKGPLSVSDSQPVYIYSVGPDCDEKGRPQGYEHYPEPLYDPTNGSYSKGDLVMEVKP